MASGPHGTIPVPDYRRVHRAGEPRLRHPVPAILDPVENANARLAKTVTTLYRAGSSAVNPILAGLGTRLEMQLAAPDRLTGLYVFRDRADLGANLLPAVSLAAPGLYVYDFQAGAGPTEAGSPAAGATRNFLRFVSRFGAVEHETWIKTYDHDVVTLAGQAALDSATMLHVCVEVAQLASGVTWIPVAIAFMPSWKDEFDRPCFGGAAFVSIFDAAGEGMTGTVVESVTQQAVETVSTVNVQNTPGEKHFTVRFRSKQDSAYKVDVEVCVEVIPPDGALCYAPVVAPCADVLLKKGVTLPANTPAVPSVPGVPTVAGVPGTLLAQDLLYVMLAGYTVGTAPTLVIRRWAATQSDTDLAGVQFMQVGEDVEYMPLIVPDTVGVPNPGLPYGGGAIYCVALSVTQLKADNVAILDAFLKDGVTLSRPMAVAGPRLRDLQYFAAPETGGGQGCCGVNVCVAGGTPIPPHGG